MSGTRSASIESRPADAAKIPPTVKKERANTPARNPKTIDQKILTPIPLEAGRGRQKSVTLNFINIGNIYFHAQIASALTASNGTHVPRILPYFAKAPKGNKEKNGSARGVAV